MTQPPVSVIVVSRHRTKALLDCVAALCQQDHTNLELVVVADPAGLDALRALGLQAKLIPYDLPNISAARNLGLESASGEVVAFIDDDAVAEPSWATRLSAPFGNAAVTQASGFVRGRNGISYQWRAMEVDATGQDHPLVVVEGPSLHRGSAARTIKTQGTNCAFRRDVLMQIGGFDPALRYFLDDADICLRLAARGGLTAVVPDAEVQHGVASSARRRQDRVPLSLHEIGASTAVFLRRHAPETIQAALVAFRKGQHQRLLRFMVQGGLEPRDVARLLQGLDDGIADGQMRPLKPLVPLISESRSFVPLMGTRPRTGIVLSGWVWQRGRLAHAARAAHNAGQIVTVLILSPSPRRHHQRFADGTWWQRGGVHGASERSDPTVRFWRRKTRIAREIKRLERVRPT